MLTNGLSLAATILDRLTSNQPDLVVQEVSASSDFANLLGQLDQQTTGKHHEQSRHSNDSSGQWLPTLPLNLSTAAIPASPSSDSSDDPNQTDRNTKTTSSSATGADSSISSSTTADPSQATTSSAAAATTTSIPMPTTSPVAIIEVPRWIAPIVDNLRVMTTNNLAQTTLKLDVPGIGEVTARVRLAGQEVHLSLTVNDHSVGAEVDRDAGQLNDALSRVGLKLANVSVETVGKADNTVASVRSTTATAQAQNNSAGDRRGRRKSDKRRDPDQKEDAS